MSTRIAGMLVGAAGIIGFARARPAAPMAGSDCEVLAAGLLREPIAAMSSVAIIVAGWAIARWRPVPGVAILLAGAASFAAHATAHPTARALDGITAALAVGAVLWSTARDRPHRARLVAAGGVGALAVTLWLLTRTDAPLCDVAGPWGHAAWHVLLSIAAVLVLAPGRGESRR